MSYYGLITYNVSGASSTFAVPFPYLSKEHVRVTVNGAVVTPEWSTGSSIKILPAPVGFVQIRRVTPKNTPIVDFTDGSILLEQDLDLSVLFSLYCSQEASDATEEALRLSFNGQYNSQGRRIENLGAPDSADDAANKDYVDTADAGGRAYADAQDVFVRAYADQGDVAARAYTDAQTARVISPISSGAVSVLAFLTPDQRVNAFNRLGTLDCSAGIQTAINAAANGRLEWPAGYVFGCAKELIVRSAQEWSGGGRGQMLAPFSRANDSITELRAIGDGSAYKTVKTRVLYRGSADAPRDAPISALVNVQHQGFSIKDMVIRCNYNPDTIMTTPMYLGDNWDVGIFVGCRLHSKFENIAVVGCFRVASIYEDVTRGHGLPELFGWDGIQHDAGGTQYGGDGCTMSEVITWGGAWGIYVRGADPKPGLLTYGVDYTTSLSLDGDNIRLGEVLFTFRNSPDTITEIQIGSTVTESARYIAAACDVMVADNISYPNFESAIFSASGAVVTTYRRDANSTLYASAFTASSTSGGRVTLSSPQPATVVDPAPYFDGTTSVPDQRGNYGFSDFMIRDSQIFGSRSPTQYVRTPIRADKNWLIDTGGGALCVDGLAGNSSRMLQGHRYFNVRFDCAYDSFCVKLGKTHRDEFFACHWDGTGSTGYFNTDGTNVGTDPKSLKYGSVTRIPLVTRRTRFYSRDTTPYSEYFSYDDAGSGYIADGGGGSLMTGMLSMLRGNIDMNQSEGLTRNVEVRMRSGNNAQAVIRMRNGMDSVTKGAFRYDSTSGVVSVESAGAVHLKPAGGSVQVFANPTDPSDLGTLVRWRSGNLSRMYLTETTLVPYVDVRPSVDNAQTMGASSNRWSHVYTVGLYASTVYSGLVVAPAGELDLRSGSTADLIRMRAGNSTVATFGPTSTVLASTDIRPTLDVTTLLGTNTRRWLQVYSQNIVLTPPASVNPTGLGDMTFELTSNTLLKIKVRGSDGILRTASLALA